MSAAWEYLGAGRHREVWRHGNYVWKVPLNEEGIADNYYERSVWLRHGYNRGYVKYARCRLLGSLLVMQYARCNGALCIDESGYIPLSNCPEWAYSLDCWQVGYNRFGQIVAYDYGIY